MTMTAAAGNTLGRVRVLLGAAMGRNDKRSYDASRLVLGRRFYLVVAVFFAGVQEAMTA